METLVYRNLGDKTTDRMESARSRTWEILLDNDPVFLPQINGIIKNNERRRRKRRKKKEGRGRKEGKREGGRAGEGTVSD